MLTTLKNIPVLISQIKKKYRTILRSYISRFHHHIEVKRIRKKAASGGKIKVVFLLMDIPLWKTDSLYKRMVDDPLYDPLILAIPRTDTTEVNHQVDEVYDHFKNLGYKIVNSFDSKTQTWLDLEKDIKPDIIFITNPHKLTLPQYYIKSFLNKLTCYVPYFEQTCDDYSTHFNNETVNRCWCVFQINELHRQISKKHSFVLGRNVIVTGYPAMEPFYSGEYITSNVWRNNGKKKIIIAPHHSIENSTKLSNATFLTNADYFVELAKLYKTDVDFAFKPHPLLKQKLYEHKEWGKIRTDKYWNFWQNSENTQLESGPYIDLFIGSDAMIHDCTSFIIEYLYVKKPVLYLNNTIRSGLNEYGQMGFDAVLKVESSADIDSFINNVISNHAANISDITNSLIPKIPPSVAVMNHFSTIFEIESK